MDDQAALETFCREFASLDGPRVLVHGGGVAASRVQELMGIRPVKIQGRRVTDTETLKVVTGICGAVQQECGGPAAEFRLQCNRTFGLRRECHLCDQEASD